jgi:hypothetical protein
MTARRIALHGFLVIVAGIGLAAQAKHGPKAAPGMRASMPAGYDVVTLQPSKAILSLIGMIECPELEGAQHVADGLHRKLVSAEGETITEFPQRFSFRITASLQKIFAERPVSSVDTAGDPQTLLLNLKFRIRAFDGLEVREIVPQSIEMIGMPADVPYDERVYRVNIINNGSLPITDRLVLEIFSPQGELLTHFPFSPL